MTHADSLILTLVGGFVLAFVFGMLANRLKLSPLVGYLVARPGLFRQVLGPYLAWYAPGFHPWRHDDRALAAQAEASLSLVPAR